MAAWVLCTALIAAAISQTAGRTIPPTSKETSGDSKQAGYISQATALYNSKDDGKVVYKLLDVPPKDESHDSENISFTIKETMCLKSYEKEEECPFKEDGVVKNCTASPPGPEGRRLEVRCQTIDTLEDISQIEDNKKPNPVRSHHVYKPLAGNKKQGINFLQFNNRNSQSSHSAASCLGCIFDYLNTNPSGR